MIRRLRFFLLMIDDVEEIILRIHNCLYSFGEFNLLSVSQMQMESGNVVDFAPGDPHLLLEGVTPDVNPDSESPGELITTVKIPLTMNEGLYSLFLEPLSPDDIRFTRLPIFDVTSPGPFVPTSQKVYLAAGKMFPEEDPHTVPTWTIQDYDVELTGFCDNFLAPAGTPPARKQYDIANTSHMSDLSIRFLGIGTDRLIHTVGISNGLEKPVEKAFTCAGFEFSPRQSQAVKNT
jgi:hypothetical protein